MLAPDPPPLIAPVVPVPSSLDGLSDTTPTDGLTDAGTLKEILRVQLQLLAVMTANSGAPPPQTQPDATQATLQQPAMPPTALQDAPQDSQTPTQPLDWHEQRRPPHLHLPTFDGSGSIDRFLERYEAYARVQRLQDQRKIDTLFAQLRGEAADWYAQATLTAPPQTWTEVSTLLIRQFRAPDYAARNVAALHHRKKQPHETLRTYWRDLLYIGRCVDPAMPEAMQRLYLQQGLPMQLQYHMIAMPKTPLSEVLGLLELMDAADRKQGEDQKSAKSGHTQTNPAWSRPHPSKGRRGGRYTPSQQVSGGNFSDNNKYTTQPTLASHAFKAGPSADEGGASACPPRPRPPRICYRCRQPGHFARECPSSGSEGANTAPPGSPPEHSHGHQSAGRQRPSRGRGSYRQPQAGPSRHSSHRPLLPPPAEVNTNHQVPEGENE